jgi:hypothetical protein
MIQASLQFKFKEICWKCQLLLDLSIFGDDWMERDDQLLNNAMEKV